MADAPTYLLVREPGCSHSVVLIFARLLRTQLNKSRWLRNFLARATRPLERLFTESGFVEIEQPMLAISFRMTSAREALTMMQEAFGAYTAVVADCPEAVQVCWARWRGHSSRSKLALRDSPARRGGSRPGEANRAGGAALRTGLNHRRPGYRQALALA